MKHALMIFCLLFVTPGIASAESLWRPTSRSIFADSTARGVGDVLTVLVVEATKASHSASHKTAKGVDIDTEGGSGPVLTWIPALSLSTDRESEGAGSTAQTTAVTDRITVTVTAVDPQGNLIVSGSRILEIAADHMELSFSGKVRPADINADNTILSSNVADMQVNWTAKGPIAEKQKPGLLYRLIRFLW